MGGSEADIVALFFFFGGGRGLVDFFAPTEAAPSEIARDAGRGLDKGGGLLGAANLPLGERFVMDAAAALVRDENNLPTRDDTEGESEAFPSSDDRADWRGSSPILSEAIYCVILIRTDECTERATNLRLPWWVRRRS